MFVKRFPKRTPEDLLATVFVTNESSLFSLEQLQKKQNDNKEIANTIKTKGLEICLKKCENS